MSGQDVGSQAGRAVSRASNSEWLERAARAGFVVSGIMHLLIAYIALQVAWGGSSTQADQSGALGMLAQNSLGRAGLWLGVVGFLGLAIWQATETVVVGAGRAAKDKAAAKGKAAAKAAVYLALAITTLGYARGSAGSTASEQSVDFTAALLQKTGGRALVVLLGLVVVGVGVYHVRKGVTRRFRQDLVGAHGRTVERLGVAGYLAKGVALGVVGLLFVLAGVQAQPSEATGLDGALKTLRDQPFGAWLLTAVALGVAAYGVYSFARARYARI